MRPFLSKPVRQMKCLFEETFHICYHFLKGADLMLGVQNFKILDPLGGSGMRGGGANFMTPAMIGTHLFRTSGNDRDTSIHSICHSSYQLKSFLICQLMRANEVIILNLMITHTYR
jgi:hypothetical protein